MVPKYVVAGPERSRTQLLNAIQHKPEDELWRQSALIYKADSQTMIKGASQTAIRGTMRRTNTDVDFYGTIVRSDTSFRLKTSNEKMQSKEVVFDEVSNFGLQKDSSRVRMGATPPLKSTIDGSQRRQESSTNLPSARAYNLLNMKDSEPASDRNAQRIEWLNKTYSLPHLASRTIYPQTASKVRLA